MSKEYNGSEDMEKVIREFLLAFFETIEENSTIASLSSEGMKFCNKYQKYFYTINSDFNKYNPLQISLMLDTIYTAYITNSYNKELILRKQNKNNNENVISKFEVNSASQYFKCSCDYCGEKKYPPFPECFKTVILIISRKFISEQNVYKYCKDYTSEMVEGEESFKSNLENIRVKFETDINKLSENTKNSIRDTEKKATETNITILGIFSAIVLTFNAGVSFASIVLENLISSSIYRAISITLIFSLILGNVILGLFLYLERVRCGGNLSTPTSDKPEEKGATPQDVIEASYNNKKKGSRSKHKGNSIKHTAFVMNMVIVALLFINSICWSFGVAEKRNVFVNNCISQMATNDEA